MAAINVYSETEGISLPLSNNITVHNVKVYFEDTKIVFEFLDENGSSINKYSAEVSTFGGSVQSLKKFFPSWNLEIALNDKETL